MYKKYIFCDKDVAITYDNHINVQEIYILWDIDTSHTFVPAFSGTHGICLALIPNKTPIFPVFGFC